MSAYTVTPPALLRRPAMLCAALLLTLPALTMAAADFNGELKQHGANGESLASVTVSAEGSESTTSDQDGQFSLHFAEKNPGDRIELKIFHPSWSVINNLELQATLNQSATPQTYVMVPEEQLISARKNYYQEKFHKIVEQRYQAYAADKKQNAELTEEQQQRLEAEHQESLAQASHLASMLAELGPNEGLPEFQQAVKLYLTGDLQAATDTLIEEDLMAMVLQESDIEAESRQQRLEISQALRLRGNFLAQAFDFTGAIVAYKKADLISANNFRTWFSNASFYQDNGRLDLAERYYFKALALAQRYQQQHPDSMRPDIGDTLNNIGMLYHMQAKFELAADFYQQALQTWQHMAAKHPEHFEPDVGITYNNLGALNFDRQKFEQARKAYQAALQIFEKHAVENPDIYNAYVVQVKQNIAELP